MSRIVERWKTEISPASLRLVHRSFGLIMAAEMARYLLFGWVQAYYVEPKFHFSYPGFSWVRPLDEIGMVSLFVAVGLAALAMAWGLGRRAPALAFTIGFGAIFLMDQSYYQNHLYLVVLVGAILSLMGLERGRRAQVWMLDLMRLQVAVVYFFGGVAKINPDWLAGRPMSQWMSLRQDWAYIGPVLKEPNTGVVMAQMGMLFDLLIVPLLLWRRTRALAFVAVVIFHASNAVLFKIGVFPFLMVALTTVFFSPHWCQRWTRREPAIAALPMGRWVVPVVLIWMLAQVVIPVRSVWMYGDPAWTEEGHRFSWRMKLRSKVGRVVFHALDKETGHHQVLDPKDSLTPYQARKMATRPRMILDFAHHLRDSLADQGSGRWAIHADARVSLNQRPVQSLIDPAADLAQVVPEAHPSWIVPLQE